MSKVLKTAAIVVGAVALVATGVGAAAGVGAFGTVVAGSATAATLATVGTIASVASVAAAALSLGAGLTAKKPGKEATGSQTSFSADPSAGIPLVIGETGTAGNIALRRGFDTRDSGDNDRYALIAILSLGPIAAIMGQTIDKVPVNYTATGGAIGAYSGFMWSRTQLGAIPEPAALDFGQGAGTPPGWTAQHKLSGLAAVSWMLRFDTKAKLFTNGVPAPMWKVRGVLAYDPRKDSTYPGGSGPHRMADPADTAAYDAAVATWEWTENPYLLGLRWAHGFWHRDPSIPGSTYQRVMGMGAPQAGIDVAAFVEGANIAQANGWKAGGVIFSGDNKWASMKKILQAGMGEPVALGARISCFVNAPKVSLATITVDDVIGEASVAATQPRRDRFNTVTPRYPLEANGWKTLPGSPISVDTHVREDGGKRTKVLDYPFIQDTKQVATAVRYDIENAREFGPIILPLKLVWMGYKPGDCVTAHLPEVGLVNQQILLLNRDLDAGAGITTMTARSETAAKHPFALGQTTTPPATPGVSGPPLIPVPAEGAWNVSGTVIEANGAATPALIISGAIDAGSADAVVIEYRRFVTGQAAGAGWMGAGIFEPGVTRHAITSVQGGTAYEAAVSYGRQASTGERRILGPVQTGGTTLDFDNVSGPKKPDDNATNSADPDSPFGPSGTVKEALAALDDIVPIKSDVSALEKAKVEHDDALALLDSAQVDMAAIQRQAERDAGKLDEAMLRLVSESARTREVLRDAGIVVDPATGVVRIYAVDQVAERTSRVEVGLDSVRGTVALKASSEWVREQIALAVLNPEQAAQLEPIIKRLAAAELIVDGLTGAIVSKAEAADVTDLGGRVTTVSESLDTLTGTIKEKVDRTTFDSLGETVQSIEQTLSTLGDTAGMSLTIRQARLVADDAATAALRGAIAGDEANRRQIVQAAEARQDIYTRIHDGELTEARARLALAVEVGGVRAMTVAETAARIDAVGAVASDVRALGATSGEQAAAIGEISKAALTAQGGVASTQMTIRQVVDRADTSDEALLRALIAGDEASRARQAQVVQIQTEFATTLVANEQASAVARQSLLARMGAAEAAIVENSRVLADTARSIVERLTAAEAVVNDKVTGLAATRARLVDEAKLSAERSAAIAESLQTLDATITDAKTGLPAAHAGIAQVAKAVVDGDKATAELVEQVTAKLGDLGTATVQDLIKAVVEETGRIMATRTIAIDINGNVVGTQLVGAEEGRGSLNLINADFRLGTGRIILNTGTSMLAIGVGFGAQNDLLLWYGPTMALTECSRSNARMHLPTVGQAYFGGGLSAGSKSTPGETMSLSADAAATVSWFGSDGRPVQYVCAWSYRSTSERVYPPTAEGRDAYDRDVAAYNATGDGFQAFGQKTVEQPRSTVTLSRTFDGNTYTQLEQVGFTTQRLTFRGIAPSVGDAPGRGTFTTDIGGGFTTRDPVQSTANRALRLALSRGFNLGVDGVVQRLSIVAIEE